MYFHYTQNITIDTCTCTSPLLGGYLHCVLYSECPLSEVPLHITRVYLKCVCNLYIYMYTLYTKLQASDGGVLHCPYMYMYTLLYVNSKRT